MSLEIQVAEEAVVEPELFVEEFVAVVAAVVVEMVVFVEVVVAAVVAEWSAVGLAVLLTATDVPPKKEQVSL